MQEKYDRQVGLLVQCLPLLRDASSFGLKGGTAINLFLSREPLRLSVDIDLQYLESEPRETAFPAMDTELEAVKDRLSRTIGTSTDRQSNEDNLATRITVAGSGTQIKIETSPVLRGTVLESSMWPVAEWVTDRFGYAECRLLAPAEILAGKAIAALDRQHPRDLFDVAHWFHGSLEGADETFDKRGEFRPSFMDLMVVYLASSGRPIDELLTPRWPEEAEWSAIYQTAFSGMELGPDRMEPTTILAHGPELVSRLARSLEERHVRFLQSVVEGAPAWNDLPFGKLTARLPAIRWRLHNVERLQSEQPEKHAAMRARLDRVLESLG